MRGLLAGLALLALAGGARASEPSVGTAWAVQHAPAAAAQASSSAPALTGARHIATSITVCIATAAAQAPLQFSLRDGASGAGTVLWTARLAAPAANGSACVTTGPVFIVGARGSAMTLESSAAPAAGNFATVSLAGHQYAGP